MKNKNPIPSDFKLTIPSVNRFPEFIRFVAWFAAPQQFKEPETQKEFAELIGVCEDTLTDWKRRPEFWPMVQQALSDWIKEKIPDVVGGLYLRASFKGNAKEVETFLKLAGIEIKKSKEK
jgi:hypothetical protein